jgi:hypothetical protein
LRPAVGRLDRDGKVAAVGLIQPRSADGGAAATRPVPQARLLSKARRADRASAFRTPQVSRVPTEMILTPKTRSTPSSRSSRCLGCSRSGRETHQSQMWVQQNHCRASQSSLATGSNGSSNSTTESRRPRPPAVDPVILDITNTSTGWPGSKGRPSKTSSPCSPTVISLQCACTPPV